MSSIRASMGDGGGRGLVDETAGAKTIEAEWRVDRMRLARCDLMGEDMARAGRGLEAAGPPAAIHIEAWNWRLRNDRRTVRRRIDDAAPIAHHPNTRDDRKHLADRLQCLRR